MAAGFGREKGRLTCDGVPLETLARDFGTPLYVYSAALVAENFRRFDAAFGPVPHLVCYAAKANSNLAILRLLAGLGAGADAVSGGEVRALLASGFPAERIVFSGVGKTEDEIEAGLEARLLAFNVESERELQKIDARARHSAETARVALRVNPNVDAGSHPHISTGLKHNKFGIAIGRARELSRRAEGLTGVRITGVQAHIGSQISDPGPLAETARQLAALARDLAADGLPIETVDLGGGIGTGSDGKAALTPERYAAAVLPHVRDLPFKILIEPGRSIVGPAGVLVTRVLYWKEEAGKNFVVTDAGMNDFLRPALYGAAHAIEPVAAREAARVTADVVGPVCESTDAFLRDAEMAQPRENDLLAIRDAGAFGFAMASNYNFRGRPAEVLVENGAARLVRRRENVDDLVRLEPQ